MEYTIGEVSAKFHLPISTLRYYDKQGLLLTLKRDRSGVRRFSEETIEALRLIECLKKSGMQIKDIKEFMLWCQEGNKTISKRKQMFFRQRSHIQNEILELQKALQLIQYKCWYYEEAEKDGNEKRVKNMTLYEMPDDIKKIYQSSH